MEANINVVVNNENVQVKFHSSEMEEWESLAAAAEKAFMEENEKCLQNQSEFMNPLGVTSIINNKAATSDSSRAPESAISITNKTVLNNQSPRMVPASLSSRVVMDAASPQASVSNVNLINKGIYSSPQNVVRQVAGQVVPGTSNQINPSASRGQTVIINSQGQAFLINNRGEAIPVRIQNPGSLGLRATGQPMPIRSHGQTVSLDYLSQGTAGLAAVSQANAISAQSQLPVSTLNTSTVGNTTVSQVVLSNREMPDTGQIFDAGNQILANGQQVKFLTNQAVATNRQPVSVGNPRTSAVGQVMPIATTTVSGNEQVIPAGSLGFPSTTVVRTVANSAIANKLAVSVASPGSASNGQSNTVTRQIISSNGQLGNLGISPNGQVFAIGNRLVSANGQIIPAGSRVIAANGQLMSIGNQGIANGQIIAISPQGVPANGQVLAERNHIVSSNGQVVLLGNQGISAANGQVIQAGKQLITLNGQPLPVGSQVLAGTSQVFSQGNQIVTPSCNVISGTVSALPTNSQLSQILSSGHHVMSSNGELIAVSSLSNSTKVQLATIGNERSGHSANIGGNVTFSSGGLTMPITSAGVANTNKNVSSPVLVAQPPGPETDSKGAHSVQGQNTSVFVNAAGQIVSAPFHTVMGAKSNQQVVGLPRNPAESQTQLLNVAQVNRATQEQQTRQTMAVLAHDQHAVNQKGEGVSIKSALPVTLNDHLASNSIQPHNVIPTSQEAEASGHGILRDMVESGGLKNGTSTIESAQLRAVAAKAKETKQLDVPESDNSLSSVSQMEVDASTLEKHSDASTSARALGAGSPFSQDSSTDAKDRDSPASQDHLDSLPGKTGQEASELQEGKKEKSGKPRERKQICDICYKKFNWPSDLKRHQLSHTGEKPFKCPHCDKCYTQHQHLKKHMGMHFRGGAETPIPLVESSPAGKGKSSKSSKQSSKKENLVAYLKCDICEIIFRDETGLEAHKQTAHPDSRPDSRQLTDAAAASPVGPSDVEMFVSGETEPPASSVSNDLDKIFWPSPEPQPMTALQPSVVLPVIQSSGLGAYTSFSSTPNPANNISSASDSFTTLTSYQPMQSIFGGQTGGGGGGSELELMDEDRDTDFGIKISVKSDALPSIHQIVPSVLPDAPEPSESKYLSQTLNGVSENGF